ncbi:hypothetical protein BOTBODRAFT_26622 [Botryobasidium botryosum FD-172 SS1]|uniref:Isochorismatase-like domain-containing protein n=1 Tax=Botryobasidium botryosum (strain FD-172 SS1) TaxID=930990 RepID=A0A067MYC4_BOTB1|nr:hypothetical protein BOTBODRAFT_26622 [Botryobasidium botryosum FD-172 SS1]
MATGTKIPTPQNTAFLLCDLQERFRDNIHSFESVASTARKMLRVSKVLDIPVIITEQYPKAFGPTVPEAISTQSGPIHGPFPKTKFGMKIPEVESVLNELQGVESLVVFGIESHICVLQTTIEFIERGKNGEKPYSVYVIADGVSSCNKEEVPIALAHMRQRGAHIVSSESLIYTLLGDASHPRFKEVAGIVREEKAATSSALRNLL